MRTPWRFDPRIVRELRSQRREIAFGLLLAGLAAGLYALSIPLVKDATNVVAVLATPEVPSAAKERALLRLGEVCLEVVAVFAVRYLFQRGQLVALGRAGTRLTAELRRRLMAKLLRLPVGYFSERRGGAIQSVLTNDVGVYNSAISVMRDLVEAPVKAVAAIVTIFVLDWRLALVALAMVPAMVALIGSNARRMRVAQRAVQDDLAGLAATTQEAIQGVRVVKAFGAEGAVNARFADLTEGTFRAQMRAVRLTASLRPLVELIGAAALASVFYIGGRLAFGGSNISIGNIVALATAMDVVNQGFRALSSASGTYSGVQAAADRIHAEILDVPEAHESGGGRRPEALAGRIEFRNVGFVYPDGTRALDGVSFVLEPGTSLALVGPSGAGKSTVADLLLRFDDPTEGEILLDGVPLREMDPTWIRRQVGVVPQSTFLFAGTIAENVRLGAPEASDADVARALASAHATEFAREFEGRETSALGERGARLSGGQIQRVAIARALARDPRILLLDEATSALDAASETAVTDALQEAMRSRTTLFIAHRLTTAARADRILLLSRGRTVESGTHAELLARGGEYAAMFRLFAGGTMDGSL